MQTYRLLVTTLVTQQNAYKQASKTFMSDFFYFVQYQNDIVIVAFIITSAYFFKYINRWAMQCEEF